MHLESQIKGKIFSFVKSFLNKTPEKIASLEIERNFHLGYQTLSLAQLQSQFARAIKDSFDGLSLSQSITADPFCLEPRKSSLESHPRPNPSQLSFPQLRSQESSVLALGKRNASGVYEEESAVHINAQFMPCRSKKLDLKKIRGDFEDLMSKVALDCGSRVQLQFKSPSPKNSVYVSNSNMSDNLSLPTAILSGDVWNKDVLVESTQAPSQPDYPTPKDPSHMLPPKPPSPAEAAQETPFIASLLQNSYYGNADSDVERLRKDTLQKLLGNIRKTFQFENNLTTTVKNLITFENLQIRLNRCAFDRLPFQAKVTAVVRYWFQLISHKWFSQNFEDPLPKIQVKKASFVTQITKT